MPEREDKDQFLRAWLSTLTSSKLRESDRLESLALVHYIFREEIQFNELLYQESVNLEARILEESGEEKKHIDNCVHVANIIFQTLVAKRTKEGEPPVYTLEVQPDEYVEALYIGIDTLRKPLNVDDVDSNGLETPFHNLHDFTLNVFGNLNFLIQREERQQADDTQQTEAQEQSDISSEIMPERREGYYGRANRKEHFLLEFDEHIYQESVDMAVYMLEKSEEPREVIEKCIKFANALFQILIAEETEHKEPLIKLIISTHGTYSASPSNSFFVTESKYHNAVSAASRLESAPKGKLDKYDLEHRFRKFADNISEIITIKNDRGEVTRRTAEPATDKQEDETLDLSTARLPTPGEIVRGIGATKDLETIRQFGIALHEAERHLIELGLSKSLL